MDRVVWGAVTRATCALFSRRSTSLRRRRRAGRLRSASALIVAAGIVALSGAVAHGQSSDEARRQDQAIRSASEGWDSRRPSSAEFQRAQRIGSASEIEEIANRLRWLQQDGRCDREAQQSWYLNMRDLYVFVVSHIGTRGTFQSIIEPALAEALALAQQYLFLFDLEGCNKRYMLRYEPLRVDLPAAGTTTDSCTEGTIGSECTQTTTPGTGCSAGATTPECTASDTPQSASRGPGMFLTLRDFSIKVATDSATFCSYGDGAGAPLIATPGGPAGAPQTAAPSTPGGPAQTAPGGTQVASNPATNTPAATGPQSGTAPRDCRVCGEVWPAGHPNEALCKSCGMQGGTATAPGTGCPDCGMNQPAGGACTVCGPQVAAPSATAPKDCRVCGEAWPAGHPNEALCKSCGMQGGTASASRTGTCASCGMDRPAGQSADAPCTTCGEPAVSAPPAPTQPSKTAASSQTGTADSILDEIDPADIKQMNRAFLGQHPHEQYPKGPAEQARDAIDRQIDLIQQQFKSDTAKREAAEAAAEAKTRRDALYGHDPRLTPEEWEEVDTMLEMGYGAGGYFHGPSAADAARLKVLQEKLDAADRDRAATGQSALPKTILGSDWPPVGWIAGVGWLGIPQLPSVPAPQIQVTIHFKANMAELKDGQTAIAPTLETNLSKVLSDAPALPGPAGTQPTQTARNAGAANDPSSCKSGADGTCTTTVSYPYLDPPVIPGGPTGFLRLRPRDQCTDAPDGACTMTGDGLSRACIPQPGGGCGGLPPADGRGRMYYPYMGDKSYTKPLDFKLNIDVPVSQTSGGVIETTGGNTKPDLTLPAGTPAGVNVTGTPFTSGDGKTYVRLAFSQPFGLNFPFDQTFQQRFGDKYKIDVCFDEAPMGAHAIASSVLNSELPAAAIRLRVSARSQGGRR
jgi:hypothetical protein